MKAYSILVTTWAVIMSIIVYNQSDEHKNCDSDLQSCNQKLVTEIENRKIGCSTCRALLLKKKRSATENRQMPYMFNGEMHYPIGWEEGPKPRHAYEE